MTLLQKVTVAACLATAGAQQADTDSSKAENHPKLPFYECTVAGGCTKKDGEVTIDQNWRWVKPVGTVENCYLGNQWNDTWCADGKECAKNCALGNADEEYNGTYGVHAEGGSLKLDFVTQGPYTRNVGSRLFLMKDEESYYMWNPKNKEFSFDVNVSNVNCGLNGALYFVSMDEDGGKARYPGNTAGAKYGTGYCDAQCPRDVKFINGEGNVDGWNATGTDTGKGSYGSCCPELDIWEANVMSTAFTAHSCDTVQQKRCKKGIECGDDPYRFNGTCDKNGCDIQTYRWQNHNFWGQGPDFTIDSTQLVTVTTQFITADGTDTGKLTEIRRHYHQNGKKIETPKVVDDFDSITDEFCQKQVDTFKDNTNFLAKGGLDSMDKAMEAGMVLVLSLWDDHDVNMIWLDAVDPPEQADLPWDQAPGAARGTCNGTAGNWTIVEKEHPNASVTFSNIRFGEIGSTDGNTPTPTTPAPSGKYCCSWAPYTECGQTTDYCASSEDHCVTYCKGKWLPLGTESVLV